MDIYAIPLQHALCPEFGVQEGLVCVYLDGVIYVLAVSRRTVRVQLPRSHIQRVIFNLVWDESGSITEVLFVLYQC